MNFDPNYLSASSSNTNINLAVQKLLPLLKTPPKLTASHSEVERATFPITINKLISPLSCSVTVEKQYKGKIKGENIASNGFLGIGSIQTLHGSPDARARGYVMEDLDLISTDTHDYESDGRTVTVDGKRSLVYRSTGSVHPNHLSQLFATNIVAAFTERNLHPEVNYLIPSMMINTETVLVSLYDSEKDIWMISEPVWLREDEQDLATKSSILYIWLFINHRFVDQQVWSIDLSFFNIII